MSSGSIDALTSGGPLPDPVHPKPRPAGAPLPPPLPKSASKSKSRTPRPAPVPIPAPRPIPIPIPIPPKDKSTVDPNRKPDAATDATKQEPTTWWTLLADLFRRRELVVTTWSSIIHMVLIIALAIFTISKDKNRLPMLIASPDIEPLKPDLVDSPTVEAPSAAKGPQIRALTPPATVVKAPIKIGVNTAPQTVMSLNEMILNDSAKVGGAAGMDTVSFFGSTVMAKRVIFVVDNSSSMDGPRIKQAKEELLTAVSNLSPQQYFYVYFFSDRDYPMLGPKAPASMVKLDTSMWEAVLSWVTKHDTFPDTMAESALRKAYAMKPDVIYLLTDGEFFDGTYDFLMKMKYAKVRVNTIGFYTNDAGREVLQNIAKALKGEYTDVK